MLSNFRLLVIISVAGLAVAIANAEQRPVEKSAPSEKLQLQKKELGTIKPVHALGDIYLAGQPSPEDLPILKRAGIKTIITVRKPGEIRWPEEGAVKEHGMDFVQVPFAAPEELTPKVFDELRKVLNSKKRGPTVFHCGSANRVGAIWYAHRVLDGKLTHDAALKEAKTVGLRTPAYLERAQTYVKNKSRETSDESLESAKR